jgi:glutamate synthase domain-containing protein 2
MVYKCSVCGYIYDEEKEGKPLSELGECPVCKEPIDVFEPVKNVESLKEQEIEKKEDIEIDLNYPAKYKKKDAQYRYIKEIHDMSVTGETLIDSMGPLKKMPDWDDILILGAQLNPMPLLDDAHVDTRTVIGKKAKKPMVLDSPIYISHMSFGSLSKEAKISIAKGSAMARTATSSGEGGILPEEREAAYKYIFEYIPNKYSVTDENLRNSDAIEIKIGQGAKPGMGGLLPGNKVTPDIARIRNKAVGQNILSPSKFPDINSKEDLRDLVTELRDRSEGRPIGIKIAGGRIEKDLECVVFAEPDFVTIDGRGGATGATPLFLRDSAGIPTVYALYRARKYLDSVGSDIDLVITGGLRVSSDFAKALAMGADAVAIASAAMVSIACEQYRICHTGRCPVGITTHDEKLRERFDGDAGALRLANFLRVSLDELKTFARITGNTSVHDLSVDDLCTISREISDYTNIPHA